jgi:energy-coupling factor transporter ATP-binding protein EcfA2
VLNALVHTTSGAVLLAVLVVGGSEVIAGEITTGQLFQFIGYLGLMTFPLEILGWTVATLPRAHAAAMRIDELFEVEPETDAGKTPVLRGALRVEELTFTYPNAERPALENISFTLRTGQKLGLVGPVGSGKSTLLALLMRLYDPPRGTIFVDDHDILYRSGTERVLTPFKRHASNPVVPVREYPWEVAIGWTSIYRDPDTGKYQLWYQAFTGGRLEKRTQDCAVCYAESDDGIHFEKPMLDLFRFENHAKTNIVLIGNGGYSYRWKRRGCGSGS